jgi:hypothetical protein
MALFSWPSSGTSNGPTPARRGHRKQGGSASPVKMLGGLAGERYISPDAVSLSTQADVDAVPDATGTDAAGGLQPATAGVVCRHPQGPSCATRAAARSSSDPAPPPRDRIADLKDLADPHASGMLSDTEFTAAKAKLLGSGDP